MLRITVSEADDRTTTLRLEGDLTGPWVNELQKICETAGAGGRPLLLDLADVHYADRTGVKLLTSLRASGVRLLACTPFLNEALRTDADPELPPTFRLE